MLSFFFQNSALAIAAVWLIALCFDQLFGEPVRGHPLVIFGRCANAVEARLNRGRDGFLLGNFLLGCFLRGLLAVLILLLPVALLVGLQYWLYPELPRAITLLLDASVLYLAIGWRSMAEHIDAVIEALANQQLPKARGLANRIVSRDLQQASESELATAMVESSLENSGDALFASLFWYALAGAPGVVLHRLVNTLDAMWGYRNERYEYFGKAAARLDDLLAFLPSQLLSLSFVLLGDKRRVLRCWWSQGWRWKSINAGSVMASGAAALGLQLGGPACYQGRYINRPHLGEGVRRAAQIGDLALVFALVKRVVLLWFVVLLFVALFTWLLGNY
ncbi:cobalamin biosynthesis protein CobD [Spongiibacter sp. KMU-158]|uniref:Cobalamin biosynthesis protein CobD n=1 Tax=Spongiibacter pelagi TaxID=2760804 RepID=A0A927C0P3_9GAMM|nr:adenosylcobinamide-phosphate synthase CbiB [Spongiibacter pelagi]MBD2859109.1 cobalamin biosynthesis protein CobD [Spongiibacter pelagi]